MAERTIITFALRPGKDDDIKAALNTLPVAVDKSDFLRGLIRDYFKLGNSLGPFEPVSKPREAVALSQSLNLEGMELAKKEKSADELNDALDDLLNI